ncbi:MAG: hypothetical protein JOZ72_14380 [Alphaproteobacteria bacterium]|nr:hypothetical protein [Alphaproteobacteria bacterium]
MTGDDDTTFTTEQALAAQRELRKRLGLGDETFPLPALIGMLSDEIEKLRARGGTDAEVAATIEHATGKRISPDDVARHYANPEKRRR